MARKKGKAAEANAEGTAAAQSDAASARAETGGETISGYFRRLFAENPKLLRARSNDEVLRRWLADHPGHTEVPQNVKNGLANTKSVLRKKGRKKADRGKPAAEGVRAPVTAGRVTPRPKLELLEEGIDDCLVTARGIDPDGLQDVIRLLRRARNAVVWKLGES